MLTQTEGAGSNPAPCPTHPNEWLMCRGSSVVERRDEAHGIECSGSEDRRAGFLFCGKRLELFAATGKGNLEGPGWKASGLVLSLTTLLLVLASTSLQASSITTNAALEMTLLDIPADGLLTWTSDEHLRTAALHEAIRGFAPTGETATPRTLIVETFFGGVYVYTFDLRWLRDTCGRIQFDLESVPWGVLAGGIGAYTVLDLGTCPVLSRRVSVADVPEPVPEPKYLAVAGLVFLVLSKLVRRKRIQLTP